MENKFENIAVNNIVSFENNGMIESGVVCDVKKRTFTIRVLGTLKENGIIYCYDRYLNFFKKNGNKANFNNTYGSALAIVGNI